MTAPLSNREKLLYGAIRDVGGGIISEDVLRQKTGLGHATLWAARHGLIEKGLLELGKKGGKTTFHLTIKQNATSPSPCSSSTTTTSTAKDRSQVAPSTSTPMTSTPKSSTTSTSAASADAKKPAKRKKKAAYEKVQPFAEIESDLPHVVGDFLDIDDWAEALLAELGDVDVSPSLTSDTEYTVYAHDFHREDRYEVIETGDGISVS